MDKEHNDYSEYAHEELEWYDFSDCLPPLARPVWVQTNRIRFVGFMSFGDDGVAFLSDVTNGKLIKVDELPRCYSKGKAFWSIIPTDVDAVCRHKSKISVD